MASPRHEDSVLTQINTTFADEVARLESAAAAEDQEMPWPRPSFIATHELVAVNVRWAQVVLGLESRQEKDVASGFRGAAEAHPTAARATKAAERLREAERWQSEIGTWSTGAGEGYLSMAVVRDLQTARAWILAHGGGSAADARALAAKILADAVSGKPHRSSIKALLARIGE